MNKLSQMYTHSAYFSTVLADIFAHVELSYAKTATYFEYNAVQCKRRLKAA